MYLASGNDPTAESLDDVVSRVHPFLHQLATSSQYEGQTILVVAHAGVGRVMTSMLTGVPLADIAVLDSPNALPTELPLVRISDHNDDSIAKLHIHNEPGQ